MAKWLAVLAVAACAAPFLDSARDKQEYFNSYKGKAPPELVSAQGDWINSDKALTLKGLQGKVVWLEFSFIN